MVKTLVWSTLLYGSETWTLRIGDIRRFGGSGDVDVEKNGKSKLDGQDNE